jgi:hypothetical protein
LDIGVLGYIGIFEHKEHPPEVWHISPGTPCIRDCHVDNRSFFFSEILINIKANPVTGLEGS